jgi:hypothetical protein
MNKIKSLLSVLALVAYCFSVPAQAAVNPCVEQIGSPLAGLAFRDSADTSAEARPANGAEREKTVAAVAATADAQADPYARGRFSVSPFASYRLHEFDSLDGELGAGLALGYMVAKNIEIEVETLSEHLDDSNWADAFTEAGVNFKGYLPVGRSGFAPYGFIGYTRNLQVDENRMNAGAGIAYRYKQVGLFADGRWTHDFGVNDPVSYGHALFRVGGSVGF